MIATKTEIKALLGMTSTGQDDLIDRLIPVIEDDIREYCNNAFEDNNVYMQSGDIAFEQNSTSADTITFSGSGDDFEESLFKAGQTIRVQGSYNNDGFHEMESLTSTVMTMYTSTSRPYFAELVDEDEGVLIVITKVRYPKALQNVMAQLVKYKLSNYDYAVESETVSRYSVTYKDDDTVDGYPKSIMSGLNKWKVVKFV